MARIRSLKPEFWQDSRMAKLPALERLVFLCTWSMADDEGRIEGDALAVWRFGSFREDSREVARVLETLRSLKRVVLYEVEGNPYIQIVNFRKHQRIDHPSKSKCPAPTEGCELISEASRGIQESSRILAPDQGAGIRDQGSREQGSGAGIREQGSKGTAARRASARANGSAPVTEAAWNAYSAAYLSRYKTPPVRNDKVNGLLARFVKRIGAEESPAVAEHYVSSNRGLYISSKHAVDLLLRDCEGLRTEWATGRQVTDTEARQTDRTAATGAVFNKLIKEAGG